MEEPKITKAKDPKKVAAGKKLSFLRAEKRRLDQEKMEELERKVEEECDGNYLKLIIGGSVVLVGGVCLFRRWYKTEETTTDRLREDLKNTPLSHRQSVREETDRREEPARSTGGDLFTFDD